MWWKKLTPGMKAALLALAVALLSLPLVANRHAAVSPSSLPQKPVAGHVAPRQVPERELPCAPGTLPDNNVCVPAPQTKHLNAED